MIMAAKKFRLLSRDEWFAIALGTAVAYFIGAGTALFDMLLNTAPSFRVDHPLTGVAVTGLILGLIACVVAIGVIIFAAHYYGSVPESTD